MLNLVLKNKIIFILFVFFAVYFSSINESFAASLSMSPAHINTEVGQTFTVSVIVNSEGKSINNSEAVIKYPADILEVVSVNGPSSIFPIWLQRPTYSNSTGQISFNGGVSNPGFNGASGNISNFVFKAKKKGDASLVFLSGAIRENDGLGTNVLTSKNSATVKISEANILINPTESENVNKEVKDLPEPVIYSSTHPDQESWYSSNSATFSWKIPDGSTSIQILYSKSPNSIPSFKYDASLKEKTIKNINEGVFYFHLRYMKDGKWSNVARYKLKTDSTAPGDFDLDVRSYKDKNTIKLNAKDALSGIDFYEIQIGEGEKIKIEPSDLEEGGEYVLPFIHQGSNDINVFVYDKAGNYKEFNTSLTNSLEISSPKINVDPKKIRNKDYLTVFGKSDFPGERVEVIFEKDGAVIRNHFVEIDENGIFSLTTNQISEVGDFFVYAKNIISDNIESPISGKIVVTVTDRNIINLSLHKYYIFAGGFVVCILILLMIVSWIKYFRLKKSMNKLLINIKLD